MVCNLRTKQGVRTPWGYERTLSVVHCVCCENGLMLCNFARNSKYRTCTAVQYHSEYRYLSAVTAFVLINFTMTASSGSDSTNWTGKQVFERPSGSCLGRFVNAVVSYY